jgi:integrase
MVQREAGKSVVALRQLLSVPDMRKLALSIQDVRDRAMLILAAKTGIRRQELINVDFEDVDWRDGSIQLKPARKRTNRTVFFDDETSRLLRSWMPIRAARGGDATGPLFTNLDGHRVSRNDVYDTISEAAQRIGLHDPKGSLKQKFGPHACRHWFTTHLQRAGMPREYIAWLRGDAPAATIDIYTHIDRDQVREAYRARIPQLGI